MKNIVLFSDGTANEPGKNITNVLRIYALAEKNYEQICLYDPGIGTWGRKLIGQATGAGITQNIQDLYLYLMNNYEAGDRVFLFGFSRGAFTVRALAGMLYKVGLLRKDQDSLLGYASKAYNKRNNNGEAAEFKRLFSRHCPIYCICVFDTVASLNPLNPKFFDGKINPEVKYAFHAVAIDEKRAMFKPVLWDENKLVAGQTMKQVWFAGVHADIGGWYDERGHSNITLNWAIAETMGVGFKCNHQHFKEDISQEIHDSHTGLWNFAGTHVRKIKKDSSLHSSVYKKGRIHNYKPINLKKGWLG